MRHVVSAVLMVAAACGLHNKQAAPAPENHPPVAAAPVAPPPPPPSEFERMKAALEGFTQQMCACKDKACSDGVQEKLNAFAIEKSKQSHAPKPSEAEMKVMQDIGVRYGECLATAMGSSTGTASGSASGATLRPNDLPTECQEYEAAIKKIVVCPKIAKSTRDALDASFKQTQAAWYQVPVEQAAVLAEACKSARDAVRNANKCP